MSLIVGEGISRSWSERDVLRNVSFTLAPGQRVGMVGPNGQGKTTLLRIVAGADAPTSGRLSRKTGLAMGYLAQDPGDLGGSTLRQAMLDVFAHLHAMEAELGELERHLERGDDGPNGQSHAKLLDRYGELQHRFEDAGGYTYARRIERVLEGLELDRGLWDAPLRQLSGGQRSRAHLGRLLLQEPDVLLLDEPTNHLDTSAVEWLEGYLAGFGGAMIVVSHDRYFLDRVTGDTWEVAHAGLECFKGAYSRYVPKRAERFAERMKRWHAQQAHIAETQEFIRRFIAGQRTKEAQGRRTLLERFVRDEAIDKPRQHEPITVRLRAVQRTGDIVFQLRDLKAGYRLPGGGEKPLVAVEKLHATRGRRIAIVGPNGCGKTTLLRTILGQLTPLAGEVRVGANVQMGYLSQTHAELAEDKTALECLRAMDSSLPIERARGLLGGLGLSGDEALKKVGELSGGQRSRILLGRLMLCQPNVLVLDEPTNHLDIPSQEVLQEVLGDFDGTVVFVSHDRYLIQAMATDIWAIEGGSVKVLAGNWDKYLDWRQQMLAATGQAPADQDKQWQKQVKADDYKARRRQSNELQRLQRRLTAVEDEIHRLEGELKAIDAALTAASSAGDLDEITRLGLAHANIQQRIDTLMEEWEGLHLVLEVARDG